MRPYLEQLATLTRTLPAPRMRELHERSDLRGFLDVVLDWALIGAAFALVAARPSVLTVIAALAVIGGRQLGLAVLMHEATHRSLFRSPRLNDWFVNWTCAYPIGADVIRYRDEHIVHHKHTGTDRDPDLGLTLPYPATRAAVIRRFLRDLAGIAGLRRAAGILLIECGYLTYSQSTNVKPVPGARERPWPEVVLCGAKNLRGPMLANVTLFAILALLGQPWLYLLWIAAWLTTFSLFARIRSIAEHSGTPSREDALQNARTTLAGPVARLFFAPHHVNYHLEHHLAMGVPHYRLPALRRLLLEQGTLAGGCSASNYLDALRQATI